MIIVIFDYLFDLVAGKLVSTTRVEIILSNAIFKSVNKKNKREVIHQSIKMTNEIYVTVMKTE